MVINPKDFSGVKPPAAKFASVPPQKGSIDTARVLDHVCRSFAKMAEVTTVLVVNQPGNANDGIRIAMPNVYFTPSATKTNNDFSLPFTTATQLVSMLTGRPPVEGKIKLPRFHAVLAQSNDMRLGIYKKKADEFNSIGIGSQAERSLAMEEVKRILAVRKTAIGLMPYDFPIARLLQETLKETVEEFIYFLRAAPLIDEGVLSGAFSRIDDIALLTVLCKKYNPALGSLQVRIGRQVSDLSKYKWGWEAKSDLWQSQEQAGFSHSVSDATSRSSKPEIVLEEIKAQIVNIQRRRTEPEEHAQNQEINLRSRQLLQIYNCFFNIVNALYDICSLEKASDY